MSKKAVVTILALIVCTPIVSAQDVSLGPQLGLYFTDDADDDFNVMFGAAARLRLMPILGGEISINYRQEDYFGDELTVRSWPVMVTGMLYPIPMVYGAVGFGWYNTTYDFSDAVEATGVDDETEQEVGWHFGGGVELPISDRASITGDIRYVFLDYDFGDPPGFGDVDADFFVITAGIQFGL